MKTTDIQSMIPVTGSGGLQGNPTSAFGGVTASPSPRVSPAPVAGNMGLSGGGGANQMIPHGIDPQVIAQNIAYHPAVGLHVPLQAFLGPRVALARQPMKPMIPLAQIQPEPVTQ